MVLALISNRPCAEWFHNLRDWENDSVPSDSDLVAVPVQGQASAAAAAEGCCGQYTGDARESRLAPVLSDQLRKALKSWLLS
jgi:hypothetical protein